MERSTGRPLAEGPRHTRAEHAERGRILGRPSRGSRHAMPSARARRGSPAPCGSPAGVVERRVDLGSEETALPVAVGESARELLELPDVIC